MTVVRLTVFHDFSFALAFPHAQTVFPASGSVEVTDESVATVQFMGFVPAPFFNADQRSVHPPPSVVMSQ
ncbi:MAG: hypothetical protein WA194_01375 [Patescibacteria group bacterium]